MTTLAIKSVVEAIRTIKHPFKTIVVGVFVLLGVMSANLALGATYFSDNFDTYNLGNLTGQGGWEIANTPAQIVDNKFVSSPQSVYITYQQIIRHLFGTALDEGVWKGKMYNEDTTTLDFYLRTDTSIPACYAFVDAVAGKVYSDDPAHAVEILTGLSFNNEWVDFQMAFRASDDKFKFCVEGTCSDWVVCRYLGEEQHFDTLNKLNFKGCEGGKITKSWIDDIEVKDLGCSADNCDLCENWFDCGAVGCCWFYNPYYAITNYCGVCYEGCSWDSCGSCENQGECEGVGCYWTGEYCSWVVSECGGELACQFCESQETCEAEDCHWSSINQTCWYKAPTLPSDWSSYYDEHGGYEVPAGFVDDLAETTGKAFDTISSLFEGFAISFSNSDALARGTALGQTIPKARGYLKIFDGMFGHIPIGETFVFILIFMLEIGLFRTIRHLIQIVKP